MGWERVERGGQWGAHCGGRQKKLVLSREMGVLVQLGVPRGQNGVKGLGQKGLGLYIPIPRSPFSSEPVGRLGHPL